MARYGLRRNTDHKAKNKEFIAWCIKQLEDIKHDGKEKILAKWAYIISYPHRLRYNPDLKLEGLPSNYKDRWNTQERFLGTQKNCEPCLLGLCTLNTLTLICFLMQIAGAFSKESPFTMPVIASISFSLDCLTLCFLKIERFCRQSNEPDIASYINNLLHEQRDQYPPGKPERQMPSLLLKNSHRVNFKTGALRACPTATSLTPLLNDIETGANNPAEQTRDSLMFAIPVLAENTEKTKSQQNITMTVTADAQPEKGKLYY